jgi:hypothetical protein
MKSMEECRKKLENMLTTLVADESMIKQDSENYDKAFHDTIESRKLLESKLSELLANCKCELNESTPFDHQQMFDQLICQTLLLNKGDRNTKLTVKKDSASSSADQILIRCAELNESESSIAKLESQARSVYHCLVPMTK